METQSPAAPSAWAGAQPPGRSPNLMPNFPVPARVRTDFFDVLARAERHGVPLATALVGMTMPLDDPDSDKSLAVLWVIVGVGTLVAIGSLCSPLGWLAAAMVLVALLEFGFLGARLRRLARRVGSGVGRGLTLGNAMQAFGNCFLPYEIQVVQAGERAGRLAPALEFLGRFTAHRQAILLRMVRVVIYPIVLLPFLALLAGGVMIFVYPKFIMILSELGAPVPPAGDNLVRLSNWLTHYGGLLLLLVFPVGPALVLVVLMFRQVLAAILEYVPGLGRVLLWGAQGRFLFVLGSLLDSRVPAVDAVAMAGSASGSLLQWRRARHAARRIEQGTGLSVALEETRCLPPLVTSQLRVAEGLAAFPKRCLALGDRLVEVQANRLTRLAAMLEPVGVIAVGLMTGMFVYGIYESLFALSGAIPFGY